MCPLQSGGIDSTRCHGHKRLLAAAPELAVLKFIEGSLNDDPSFCIVFS